MAEKSGKFVLEVPLDASGIKDFKPDRPVKVVAYNRAGAAASSAVVKLDAKGQGQATLAFEEHPGGVRVVVGPENASEEDLKHLQTLSVNVSASQWKEGSALRLSPIIIPPYYWDWWWRWCREYTITGRVVCADGTSPVPGATVCAYDVDWWWWWLSQDQVGCAVTDANGAFQITFRRCCGWWPWWWWENREWQLDPILVDRIIAFARRNPNLRQLPTPSPKPSLDVFQQLLASSTRNSRTNFAAKSASKGGVATAASAIDPAALDGLRSHLLEVLPPDFPIRIWPWYPWWPWRDCDANILFQVTQTCGGQTNTIVSQTIADTRWDIPTTLNVSLTANSMACCAADGAPDGDCLVPTDICPAPPANVGNVGSVGGNVGSPVLPNPQPGSPPPPPSQQEGLYNPGVEDRPFAGEVDLYGTFGTGVVDVDYYEFQYATAGVGGPWAALPLSAVSGIPLFRNVLVPAPPPQLNKWVPIPFPVNQLSDGSVNHNVLETTMHYETINGVQVWDLTKYWLLPPNTLHQLANGTYYLRLVGYKFNTITNKLVLATSLGPDPGVLTVCPESSAPPEENRWVVTLDNQAPGNTDPSGNPTPTDPSGCPPAAGIYCQPCGTGTVHFCTNQPTTDIFQVQIVHPDNSVTPVGICGNVTVNCDDILQVDFVAYDPDAFLYEYTLNVYFGDNQVRYLANSAGSTCPGLGLCPGVVTTSWAPAALQVGPDYASALTQGAVSPVWSGGAIRLQVSANTALPTTCAYLLQLVAYKRTIVNCYYGYAQYNVTEWSFAVTNNCTSS